MANLKSEVPPVKGTLSYAADAMMTKEFPVQVPLDNTLPSFLLLFDSRRKRVCCDDIRLTLVAPIGCAHHLDERRASHEVGESFHRKDRKKVLTDDRMEHHFESHRS